MEKINISKKDIIGISRDWLGMLIGVTIYSIGYVCFQLPYHITGGGVAGIASIIYYATGFQPQFTYLLINVGLLALALKVLGVKFLTNTIYGVFIMSTAIGVATDLFNNADGTLPLILGDQSFMACIIGAVLEGIGLGLVFINNGSTGGTDIIAACINKYRDISLGQVLLICDILVASSSYLVFQKVELLLYGYCSMVVETMVLDMVMNHMRQSVQFFIISSKSDLIAKLISDAGRGVTILNGEGYYTHNAQKVLMVLAKRRESPTIFRIIKRADPNAFVSQSKVVGVFGEGFDKIKGK